MIKQMILDDYDFQRGYIGMLTDDIPDERMAEMPGAVGSNPAWQLGHMACSLDGFIGMLGGAPRFDDAWKAKFDMGSEPTSDRSAYPSKAELLEAFDERRAVIADAFKNATDEQLETPLPNEQMRPMFGTIGRFVIFGMLSHESMHCGQLATWRKAAGLPQALASIERMLNEPAEA